MFNLFRKKSIDFFTAEEKQAITSAIQAAERSTSGEVRVFIESRCRFVKAIDRASEIFTQLKMRDTAQRNGVLVYVAVLDRQLAVFGDVGIHQKVGDTFWGNAVKEMLLHFNKENHAQGIATVVQQIGEALTYHFPYNVENDVNELPDDIVFGR